MKTITFSYEGKSKMQQLANTTDPVIKGEYHQIWFQEKVGRFQERLNFSKRLSESQATIKGVNHLM